MTYVAPGTPGSIVEVHDRYDNFIGGRPGKRFAV
jgi:hypothetical protein